MSENLERFRDEFSTDAVFSNVGGDSQGPIVRENGYL